VQFSSDYVFRRQKECSIHGNGLGDSDLCLRHLAISWRDSCPAILLQGPGCEDLRSYGVAGQHSTLGNFVETMLRLARSGKLISVVNDQIVTPTSTRDLAERLVPLIRERACGLFHYDQ